VIDRNQNFDRNRNRTETRIQNFEPKPEPKTDFNRNRNRNRNFFKLNLLALKMTKLSEKILRQKSVILQKPFFLKKNQSNRVKKSYFFGSNFGPHLNRNSGRNQNPKPCRNRNRNFGSGLNFGRNRNRTEFRSITSVKDLDK